MNCGINSVFLPSLWTYGDRPCLTITKESKPSPIVMIIWKANKKTNAYLLFWNFNCQRLTLLYLLARIVGSQRDSLESVIKYKTSCDLTSSSILSTSFNVSIACWKIKFRPNTHFRNFNLFVFYMLLIC